MINNSKQIIENMQKSFPHFYNVYDKSTILYNLLSIFGERYGARTDIIDRLYAMIGIDSTYDEDLEHRWGSLLGIYKQLGESYNEYRSRLLIVYSSLAGGTAEAIKYAIASTIGITSDSDVVDRYIKVYDAWKYPNDIDESIIPDTSYGHIICTVDLQANESMTIMNDKIMYAINETKASGIYPYLLFIYTVNEVATLLYNDSIFDKVTDGFNSTGSIDSFADNNYVDSIIQKMNESGLIKYGNADMISDRYILINVNDLIDIRIDEDISTVIKYKYGENTLFGIIDTLVDRISDMMQDVSTANSIYNAEMWSNIGTNSSVVLNVDFVTNMQMETDSCIDKIYYSNGDTSAVFSKAVFGSTN